MAALDEMSTIPLRQATLSIIIPALNEARYLPAVIRSVRDAASLKVSHEIIVSDCGSSDGTLELAMSLGARVVESSPPSGCRAEALNIGAAAAGGDVLLFLDADTILPHGYDESIMSALKDQGTVGGAFEFAMDGDAFGLRLVELINRVRYRIWPRYYGDQGIFVRADVFRVVGGYPSRRIMEASDFCVSLRKKGRLALIRKCAVTSSRRFIEGGVYNVLANDIRIWWLDLIGLQTEHFADAYRDNNRLRGRVDDESG